VARRHRVWRNTGGPARRGVAALTFALYDKVSRADILVHAYALAKRNGEAPGVDGETSRTSKQQVWGGGWPPWKRRCVRGRTGPNRCGRCGFRSRRNWGEATGNSRDPGSGGSNRRLADPTADLRSGPGTHGPWLSAGPDGAGGCPGGTPGVVRRAYRGDSGDVSRYFDTIPHADLMKSLARRISDRRMLRLLKMWLKAPVAEQTAGGGCRFSGGKRGSSGTPQGWGCFVA
jgi:RNA-directed DNA polymerase